MFADGPVPQSLRWTLVAALSSLPLLAQTLAPVNLGHSPIVIQNMMVAPEIGVSHDLAIARAARLTDIHYKLSFNLEAHSAAVKAHESLTFVDAGSGDLPIDFRDGEINSANLNGNELQTQTVNGHLILPSIALHKGQNTLNITFKANIASAGKAITRYEDRDDKNEYLYTLFVPMDASMAFPCFDQPDLKARFTLDVAAPTAWTVVANTTPTSKTSSNLNSKTVFPETLPISTYLFAFAAGPFEAIHGKPCEPTIYVRKSQLVRAKAEAPQVQQMTARGIAYLSDYFAQPFPFPKYDLVLIPGFPFGGMEHAGATFLNEDSVLFRTAPTASDYFRRNTLVLHETTHQWFGDLVTMRWFDDLWLKEGFAQYMAYRAMAQLEPTSNPWKHFSEDIKPLAYAIDETEGTTPIYQDIPNLKDAKSAYGAIVYQKAPSVLKQLNFFLGEENFRNGLRLYLKQHAYANAQWGDLISDFAVASGELPTQVESKTHHARNGRLRQGNSAALLSPLRRWADDWITHPGMREIEAKVICNRSTHLIDQVGFNGKDVVPEKFSRQNYGWPISMKLYLGYPADSSLSSIVIPINLPGQEDLSQLKGKPCPAVVFANYDDEAYGRFLLDEDTIAHVTKNLIPQYLGAPPPYLSSGGPSQPPSLAPTAEEEKDALTEDGRLRLANHRSLLRSQLWASLWNSVETGRYSPTRFVQLALSDLQTEQDESIARVIGGHAVTALHSYIRTGEGTTGAILSANLERITSDRMLHADTVGLRIISFHTFSAAVKSDLATSTLRSLLSGSTVIPGVELRSVDRWNLITRLVSLDDDKDHSLVAAERGHDHSSDAPKYAFAAEAASPDADVKQRYFAQYLLEPGSAGAPPEDWITQSLRPFNSLDQADLTEPFTSRALDALPSIKTNRKIFFLTAWLAAFFDGQNTPDYAAEAYNFVIGTRKRSDPDLERKVLEAVYPLKRTALILENFPE